MKKIAKIGASVLAIASLASCASKCDFAKFQEKVKGVEKNPYATAVVKGTVKSEGSTTKIDATATWKTLAWVSENATALIYCNWNVNAVVLAENKDATYYAGTTFKYVVKDSDGDKAQYVWNKYGLLTSYSYAGTSIKITYKK